MLPAGCSHQILEPDALQSTGGAAVLEAWDQQGGSRPYVPSLGTCVVEIQALEVGT